MREQKRKGEEKGGKRVGGKAEKEKWKGKVGEETEARGRVGGGRRG